MISVVIPLYNKEKSILETIKSVLNQTYQDFELIVVDDGSTDKSRELVSTVKDGRLKFYSKSNGGVSSARNYGVEKCSGDFVAFLDGDDIWKENFLERINYMIDKYPGCSMYATGYIKVNANNPSDLIIPPNKFQCDDIVLLRDYEDYALRNLVSASSVVVDKEIFLKLNGFDPTLTQGEDLDMWFRLGLNAPLCYDSSVFVINQFYSIEYNCPSFPKDYKQIYAYKMATKTSIYLSLKDNRKVREVINTYILFGYCLAIKAKRKDAIIFFKKRIRFWELTIRSQLKYLYYTYYTWVN